MHSMATADHSLLSRLAEEEVLRLEVFAVTARSVSQRSFPSPRDILPTLTPLILAVLAVAAHASCLWNGFIWDDLTVFLSNPAIRDPEGWLSIWTGKGLPDYLPLSWSAIRICLSLFGEHPAGYHLINLMLHAANAILLWRLLLSVKVPGAVWGAALFAVHPVGAASVGWISELKNTLSLFFSLGASFAFFSTSSRSRMLSIPLFLLALLSKGSVVALPLVWAVILYWRGMADARASLLRILPYLVLSLAGGLATLWFQVHGATHHDFAANTLPMTEKILRAAWAAGFYLRQLLWPDQLSMLYADRSPCDGSPGPWIVLGMGIALTLAALLYIVRKNAPWARGWLAAITSYLLLISPVLGLLPMYYLRLALVADHWIYLPSIPILALAGALIHRIPTPALRLLAALPLIASLFCLSVMQHRKLKDDRSLWESVLETSPHSWYASLNLSAASGLAPSDREHLARQAAELAPKEPETILNLAKVLSLQERNDEALEVITTGCANFPKVDVFSLISGKILAKMNRLKEARESFRIAWKINPSADEAMLCDAQTSAALGEPAAVIEPLCDYLERHPGDGSNWYLLGQALSDAGFHEGAVKAFEKADSLCPNVPQIRIRLSREREFTHP